MSVGKLQRLLRAWFGFVAMAYGLSAVTLTRAIFLSPLPNTTATFHEQGTGLRILAVLLIMLQRLIFAIPLLLTSVFGVTWWKLKFAKPGARRWGIAASIVMLLSAIPLLVPTWWMWHEGYTGSTAVICILLILGSLASGVAGVFAFNRKESQSAIEVEAQPPRVPGDGTHKLLDVLALALQFGGTLTLISLYSRWGYDHDLPISHGAEAWMQWILVIAAATLIHESAHALVGIAVGMKLRAFIIGPFQFRAFDGRWILEFRPSQILAFSGAAGLTPVDPDQSRWNEVAAIAAGPFANLLTGAVAAALAYSAENHAWWSFWEYFALFATVSLVAGIVNLIPLQPSGLYSDGARIVQLFRRGPVADYQRAVRSIAAGNVSSRGPRTYDIHAIQCALVHYDKGEAALRLKLCSMDHFSDSGQFAEASRALEEAEHLYLDSATDAPPDLLTIFVINVVLLHRDVVAAGKWWHVVQSKKPTIFNADYWLAKCAFHWSEGDLAAASEAWNTGQAYLEKLPGTSGCNYDRNCYLRMKEVLISPPAEAADTSNAAPTAVNLPIEPVATPTFE